LDLAATFKAIVKEAQARLIELGEIETHEPETHEPEIHEQETYEREVSVLLSQGYVVDQIPTERRLSGRRTGGSNLPFLCPLSQLRKNIVITI
jgi:hypothetical protein